jgi:hypothetical protein
MKEALGVWTDSVWRHRKSGQLYQVTQIIKSINLGNTWINTCLIVYKELESNKHSHCYCQPIARFLVKMELAKRDATKEWLNS